MNLVVLAIGLALVFLMGTVIAVAVLITKNRQACNGEESVGEESGVYMFRTAYIYLVLLATLMMTIGGSVAAFMAIADLVSPPAYYQTLAEYSRMPEKIPGQSTTTLSSAELRHNYDQMVIQEQQRTRSRALNGLIKSLGWIIIPLPVFVYYQRKVRSSSESAVKP